MRLKIQLIALCAAALAGCSDATRTTAPALSAGAADLNTQTHGVEKYVAIGTSISMGWASNGVYAASQVVSFPAQLRFGSVPQMSLPLIESPGCTSPLIAPLGAGLRLSGESAAGSTVCAPNAAGVTLPTQNVSLAGALTIDALLTTPATAPADQPWYARILAPGMTQVTAALSQNPTVVSVEFGGNDILGTSSGLVVPGVTYVPFAYFAQAFNAVLSAVGSANPKVLVVGLMTDGTKLPALRRGDEIWADRLEFAALHVDVSSDCEGSDNWINVSVKSLRMAFAGAYAYANSLPNPVYSCADVPGTEDLVLTPADITTLNTQLGQMVDLAAQQAAANGYAYVSLGALYDRPDVKPPVYSVISQLTSATPYGPYVSLDGVHPSALGDNVLALAAAHALNKTYSGIAAHTDDEALTSLSARLVEPSSPSTALAQARRFAMEHKEMRLPACLLPGGCSVSRSSALR